RRLDRAPRRDLDAARELLRRRALLSHRRGDGARNIADLADGLLDGGDGADRARGGALHAGDLRADLFRGAAGLSGQRLDLAGDDGEAAAGLTCARRLDGGVEGEQ